MTNMIALDIVHDDRNDNGEIITANTTNASNLIECSLPELRRKVKMWKARSLFLDRHLKEVQAQHIHQISGIRKKNTMS